MSDTDHHSLHQTVPVFLASDFRVSEGVALADEISFADELVMDDVYALSEDAQRQPLTLSSSDDTPHMAIAGEALGRRGNTVVLDSLVTFMAPDSTTLEAIILVELQDDGVEAVYLLPLAPLVPKTPYRLMGVDRENAVRKFSEVACVSFTRGTHITMASGEQRKIEDLRVGDRVLTRDDGPQSVRWIGKSTLRAVGEFAPVVIKKGTLHNENDLVVSPDHRVFIYQRVDRLGAGRAEVLVKVRHLINGETVYQIDGGFVEYYQLLFDDHQLIFAEGIAAETLMVDTRTKHVVDRYVAGLTHAPRHHQSFEVQQDMVMQADAADILRKASSN